MLTFIPAIKPVNKQSLSRILFNGKKPFFKLICKSGICKKGILNERPTE